MEYKKGSFREAELLYTESLAASAVATEVAATLCNLALCGLRTDMLHDALAAGVAGLRLQPTAKAFHRSATALALLGEFMLADKLLALTGVFSGGGFDRTQREQLSCLRSDIASAQRAVADGYPTELMHAIAQGDVVSGGIVGEWVAEDRIGTALIEGKGRGVQALRQIGFGELLMIERPRGSVSAGTASKELLTSINSSSRALDDASQVKLKSQLTSAASVDVPLARTLAMLDDGTGKSNALMPLGDFLNQLNAAVLPLLLQRPQFFPASERTELSHQRICGVVDVNCHGCTDSSLSFKGAPEADQKMKRMTKLEGGTTSLFPAISMVNHSRSPNCVLLPMRYKGNVVAMAVAARQRLLPHEELTLVYLDDPEAVKKKWGIDA